MSRAKSRERHHEMGNIKKLKEESNSLLLRSKFKIKWTMSFFQNILEKNTKIAI